MPAPSATLFCAFRTYDRERESAGAEAGRPLFGVRNQYQQCGEAPAKPAVVLTTAENAMLKLRKAIDLADAVALGAIGLCILDKVRVAQVQGKVLKASALLQH